MGFTGKVIAEWIDHNGRDMVLRSELRFTDKDGRVWTANAGEIVNGATIPRFFWRLMPPFVGKYRYASVVHDVACARKQYNSRLAHAMFYEAMRASGVGLIQAWLMWLAVRVFGPRWECGCKEDRQCER